MALRSLVPVLAIAAAVVFRGVDGPPPGAALAQSANAGNETEEFDWQGLPPGKGREETFYMCSPCHSLRMVTQQGLSRSRWNDAIDWMVDEQEMPPLEPADRKLIVDYLSCFYGEDRKAKGGPPTLR